MVLTIVAAAIMGSCGNGTPKADLKNDVDTLSYAIGVAESQGLKDYLVRAGIDTTYIDEFIKGLNDGVSASDDKKNGAYYNGIAIGLQMSQRMNGLSQEIFRDSTQTLSQRNMMAGFINGATGKGAIMTAEEAMKLAQEKVSKVQKAQMEKLYGPWKKENEKFMAEIAKKPGIKKLDEGVYYEVITEGQGEVPVDTNRVEVNYEGKLKNDTIFDSSYERKTPTTFRVNQVIPGWTKALTHMPVGSKWKVYISADQAYGEREAGKIKPFSALTFTIELNKIVK